NLETNGERNRGLYVLKARGIAHSNQIREFRLSNQGISLLPIYVGSGGMLTGTARQSQEVQERAESLRRNEARPRLQRTPERKRRTLEAQIAGLTAAFESEVEELAREISEAEGHERNLTSADTMRARLRGGSAAASKGRRRAAGARS